MNSNKDTAISFLSLITSGDIDKAYTIYINPHFIHHNPYFKSNANALKKGMKENATQFPHKVYEIKHILEDGNFVAVHGLVKLSEDIQIATVHIFRFENKKIIEMWDIGQQIPSDASNSMF